MSLAVIQIPFVDPERQFPYSNSGHVETAILKLKILKTEYNSW